MDLARIGLYTITVSVRIRAITRGAHDFLPGGATDGTLFLQHAKDKVDDHIVLDRENVDHLAGNPPKRTHQRSMVSMSSAAIAEREGRKGCAWWCSLLHDFKVDLFHVHLFGVLRRELGALEELRVDSCGHGGRSVCGRWVVVVDEVRFEGVTICNGSVRLEDWSSG